MAHTKNCPRVKPTSPSLSPSPSPTLPLPPPLIKMTVPSTTLPSPSLPPHLALPRATPPAVKSHPSAHPPQIVVGPPMKKLSYPGPFIKGQVGSIFFSLDRVHNYMEIPHRYSLIVQSFHMRYKHEITYSKFILVDPLGNSWSAPEVFDRWRTCVENHELEDIDPMKCCLAIVHFGNTFKLMVSDKKSKYTTQTHFIPALELADKDKREKKDPDYFLPKDDEDNKLD